MTKTHTIYDAMAFAPHVHREYPKHLYPDGPDGRFVVVNDEDEELAVQIAAEAHRTDKPKSKDRP